MSLGRRTAHQTTALAKQAVDSSIWWDFHPGQPVMTVDGYPGVVTAVWDGPHAGNEDYEVKLDGGLGGGNYTAGQLRPTQGVKPLSGHFTLAAETAAVDYPELGSVLEDHPDPAHNTVLGSSGGGRGGEARRVGSIVSQASRGPETDLEATTTSGPWGLLVEAANDADFRFEVTATWADVRDKAKRLRAQGNVNITATSADGIAGNVKGDHGIYQTELNWVPGSRSIAMWHCGCKWSAYSWGRTGRWRRFEGRKCSHATAMQFEAQARGMFGRDIGEDKTRPDWLKPRSRVVVEYDRTDKRNISRPADPRKRDLNRTYSSLNPDGLTIPDGSPLSFLVVEASEKGFDPAELVLAMDSAGIDGRTYLKTNTAMVTTSGTQSQAVDDEFGFEYETAHTAMFPADSGPLLSTPPHYDNMPIVVPKTDADRAEEQKPVRLEVPKSTNQTTPANDPSKKYPEPETFTYYPPPPPPVMATKEYRAAIRDLVAHPESWDELEVHTAHLEKEGFIEFLAPLIGPLLRMAPKLLMGHELMKGLSGGDKKPAPGPNAEPPAAPDGPSVSGPTAPVTQPSPSTTPVQVPKPTPATATFHDEPEPALPETDGADDTDDFMGKAGSLGAEVAQAAKQYLAMKTFTPEEQKELVAEGAEVSASNLHRLDLTDTHYAEIEKELMKQDDEDWMMV